MEKRRRFTRYLTQRKAQYFLKEKKGDGEGCTIINVSRKGMAIIFHSDEKINTGIIIHIEIPVPTSLEPINIKGKLRWLEKREIDFIGGIELTEILSDNKFSKVA